MPSMLPTGSVSSKVLSLWLEQKKEYIYNLANGTFVFYMKYITLLYPNQTQIIFIGM